jgi:hypothetical protein
MCKLTEGQARADRLIQEEMLRVGDDLRHARDWPSWEAAHWELEELGKVAKSVRAGEVLQAESAVDPLLLTDCK